MAIGRDEGKSGGENPSLRDQEEPGWKREAEAAGTSWEEVPAAEPRAKNTDTARGCLSCPLSPLSPFLQLHRTPL